MTHSILASVVCLLALSTSAPAQVSQDAIGPQDQLALKVLEWLPAKGEYKEWTAIGGEYSIEPGDTINVPFAGQVSTANRTPAQVSRAVADNLQRNLSLPLRPEVGVEIVRRSPVYVIGGVETPGKIEFTPGLTALEAVALAGGFYRGGSGDLRLERDVINAEGELDVARDSAARIVARISRLEAELADGNEVRIDPGTPDVARAQSFVAEERRLLEIRKQARDSQLESLRNRRQLAIDQLKALDEKGANLARQVQLSKQQLGSIESLVDKGLTVASRRFELERTLSDFEGRVLDVQNSRLQAQLEMNESERLQTDVVTQFNTNAANELQAARASLSKARIDIARGEQLVREATVIAPEKLMDRAGNTQVGIRFFRTHKIGNSLTTSQVGKDETLQAGDTLQVQLDVDQRQGQAGELLSSQ